MSASKSIVANVKLPPRNYGKIVLTLENVMLKNLDEISPSQIDGLDRETEMDLRILGCELIQTAGILLKLPQVAMATGQVLFQRFFYSKSFVRHSMESTAMSTICLASKIEEAPRRIRDVINVFHHIKQVRAQKQITPMILDQNYINLKSQVIKAERRVLKELGFCVHVKHPHKLIVMYLKYLDFETHQQMMQTAWNYMNDSFRTDVFVRYQPETIACACIYLTARKLNIALPNNQPHWFDIFKVTEEDIIDVCYRISALYRRKKPSLEELEEAVEKLKLKYQELRKNRPGINTPPLAVTTADRNNGSHNAWGGFISRAVPVISSNVTNNSGGHNNHGDNNNGNNVEDKDSATNNNKKRSHSRSRSRSPRSRNHSRSKSKTISRSHTPVDDKYGGGRKKTRNRSRTPKATSKKKSRNYSRSSSSSPHGKHKKSDKKYDRRPSPSSHHDRDRYSNGSSLKYRSGGGVYRDESRGNRDRDYKEYKDHKTDYRNNGGSKYINSKSYHSSSSSSNNKHRERERSRDRRR